jgi:cytochrome c biogenesis protein CcmG, thiol:disulfide interchange protein DsbE
MPSDMLTRRSALQHLTAMGVATCGLMSGRPAHANALHVGERAPPATLVTLDGQKVSTPDLGGNVVILTFWATWCVPCRDELPLLSKYAAEHASQGLRVLGFSLDPPEEVAGVRAVASSLSFPNGLLASSSAPGYGRIWRIPVNFTIDRSGRLVDNGWLEKKPVWTAELLDRIVTPLLTAS